LIQEAIEMGDKIAVMTKSPGTIEKIFINELKRPRNKRSEGFFELEDKIAYVIKP
jgi:ABC-type nitrate/sulfonate/bicarbonate transport system ATPase subunit